MNIIDAWKAAKVGQKITRGACQIELTKRASSCMDSSFEGNTSHAVVDALVRDKGYPDSRMFDSHVLADDWEVVKTPKKITIPFAAVSTLMTQKYIHNVPHDAQVTIEWEE